jgi:hypothetical protein
MHHNLFLTLFLNAMRLFSHAFRRAAPRRALFGFALPLFVMAYLWSGVCVAFAQENDGRAAESAPPKSSFETQVPFDKEGKVWIITEEMERRHRFFPSYRNVIDARLFQLPDSSFVVELTQLVGNAPEYKRRRLSLVELVDLRNRVSDALQNPAAAPQMGGGFGQSGGLFGGGFSFAQPLDEVNLTEWEKTSLVLSATTLGLAYGFFADALQFSSGSASILPGFGATTLIAPLAFGGGSLFAVSQPWFTRSSGLMLGNGLSAGFLHGIAAYLTVADPQSIQGGALGFSGLVGSALEGSLTLRLPEELNLRYGQTSMMVNMGSASVLTGALAAVALGAFDAPSGAPDLSGVRITAASSLLGSAGGYFLGYRLGQGQHIAAGDDIVFENPARLAMFVPLSLALLPGFDFPDLRLIAGATIAAEAAGYFLGNQLIANKDFSFDQGLQINQAVSLGTTVGLIPLYAGLSTDVLRYAPVLSILGGAVGFVLSYVGVAKQAEINDKERRAREGASGGGQKTSFLFGDDREDLLDQSPPSWAHRYARHIRMEFSPLGIASMASATLGMPWLAAPLVSVRADIGAIEREHTVSQLEAIKRETAQ